VGIDRITLARQLGHLIVSEHDLIEMVCPDSMPKRPDGFKEKYSKETAELDDPGAFHKKDEYLRLMNEQRGGTLAALEKRGDADLEKPSPEPIQKFGATAGAVFSWKNMRWILLAGQGVIMRRQLGRKPLFLGTGDPRSAKIEKEIVPGQELTQKKINRRRKE